ncbi:MAG: hypothetical protein ACRC1K_25740 [Planctomycetia bacterium]
MKFETIEIYIGRWNDRDYVFSLQKEKTFSLVKEHFAFGDPMKEEYAVGNIWAAGEGDTGWRIVDLKIRVPVVEIDFATLSMESALHFNWQCPYCQKNYSDEWMAGDKLPVLLSCNCEDASRYILGVSASTNACA